MQIDKSVPIPDGAPQSTRGRRAIYPFAQMDVGDSIAMPLENAVRLRSAAEGWKGRHSGWNFRVMKSPDTIRIWRTA